MVSKKAKESHLALFESQTKADQHHGQQPTADEIRYRTRSRSSRLSRELGEKNQDIYNKTSPSLFQPCTTSTTRTSTRLARLQPTLQKMPHQNIHLVLGILSLVSLFPLHRNQGILRIYQYEVNLLKSYCRTRYEATRSLYSRSKRLGSAAARPVVATHSISLSAETCPIKRIF
jgi:hypothetical protein